jgi:ABC-type Fe3+/spermidine/putrescine transport system ATPase subunit
MELLTVANISLLEHGNAVLQDISFQLPARRKLAVAGASGAGKSTLLQIIAGLTQPTAGDVRVRGDRVRGPAETLVPGHPGVAYSSQKAELPHSLRVEQVLRYANMQPAAAAQALFVLCRIEHLLLRRTDQLSGGEQQRVALARLLLGAPQLLLLDEPFSNLDRVHKRILQDVIEDVGARLGITCLLVSHDAADTLPWADEILVLQGGRIVQQGSPRHIYFQPVNEHAAALFGDYNLVRGADRRRLVPSASAKSGPKALLVRPEQLRLGPVAAGALTGRVRAVRFLGNAYDIDVDLDRTHARLRVRAGAPDAEPGQRVGVTLAAGCGALPEVDVRAPAAPTA